MTSQEVTEAVHDHVRAAVNIGPSMVGTGYDVSVGNAGRETRLARFAELDDAEEYRLAVVDTLVGVAIEGLIEHLTDQETVAA